MKTDYFKLIGFVLFPYVVMLGVAYLLGSFLATSWNPTEWSQKLRIIMAAFGLCYGFALWIRLEWAFNWKKNETNLPRL